MWTKLIKICRNEIYEIWSQEQIFWYFTIKGYDHAAKLLIAAASQG